MHGRCLLARDFQKAGHHDRTRRSYRVRPSLDSGRPTRVLAYCTAAPRVEAQAACRVNLIDGSLKLAPFLFF